MSKPSQPSSLHFANAVFAGGGVRGIAHVGALEVAESLGYRWQHVAGTSAGAIIASLVAAGYTAQELRTIMDEIDYSRFASNPQYDLLHLTEMSNVFTRGGLHDASYIETFVHEKLEAKGVHTFGDLLLQGQENQPDLFQRYRLTVIVSDITQGRIVRLPQDAHLYGLDPNALNVARAVRMSASIPFFFIPLQLADANGNRSCIVDGGLLSNYPLFLFEHTSEGQTSALPTLGFQLVDAPHPSIIGNNRKNSNLSNNDTVLWSNERNVSNDGNVQRSSNLCSEKRISICNEGVEETPAFSLPSPRSSPKNTSNIGNEEGASHGAERNTSNIGNEGDVPFDAERNNGNIGNEDDVPFDAVRNSKNNGNISNEDDVERRVQKNVRNNGNIGNDDDVQCRNERNVGNDDVPQATGTNISNNGNVPCGIDMLKALISTMLSAHDRLYIDEQTFAHTIAIPTHGIASTQFNLTKEQAQQLYESGKSAATAFFKTWNFEAYTATYRSGNTPVISRQTQIHQNMKQHLQRQCSSCNDV